MTLRLATALALIICLSGGARAEDFTEGMEDYWIANEAGAVIGGAAACGYSLDMTAVQEFIKSKIAAMKGTDRQEFRSSVDVRDFQIRDMPENERVAQCTLQRELAMKYGFLK